MHQSLDNSDIMYPRSLERVRDTRFVKFAYENVLTNVISSCYGSLYWRSRSRKGEEKGEEVGRKRNPLKDSVNDI